MVLSEAERQEIAAAVDDAERRTTAHFAVIVFPASDDYPHYPILWAALFALVVGNIVALAWRDLSAWWIVALQAALFIAAGALLHQKWFRYRLVPERIKKLHAAKLARLEYAALIHDHARGNVGLLLFVSEAERHVELLAHRGIDERVEPGTWDQIVSDFVAGRAADRVSEPYMSAIAACATILERHFPASAAAAPAPPRIGGSSE